MSVKLYFYTVMQYTDSGFIYFTVAHLSKHLCNCSHNQMLSYFPGGCNIVTREIKKRLNFKLSQGVNMGKHVIS